MTRGAWGRASRRAGAFRIGVVLLLLSSSSIAGAAPVTMIAEEPVVPGGVVVRIYGHAIETQRGPLDAWTFVSDGLRTFGQKELVFTVKRAPGEKDGDYPRDLLAFYRTVDALARRGRVVDVGGESRTRPTSRGFLGRPEFHCILYTPYQPLDGIPIAGPSITALIVTCNEADATQFGLTRVMARLGAAERFYPTTPWADRERPELIGPDEDAGSVLAKMPLARFARAGVRRERSGKVVLTLGTAYAEVMRRFFGRMTERSAFALLVTVDPSADACLVWSPGQKEAIAISPPGSTGSRVAANFVAFAPGVDRDQVTVLEDGIAVASTAPTWNKLKSALESGTALSLPSLGQGFEIVWRAAEDAAALPSPALQLPPPVSKVPPPPASSSTGFTVSNLVLYQPEAVLGARARIPELAAYVKRLEAVAADGLPGVMTPEALDLVVAVKPGRRARVWFVTERSPADPVLGALRRSLEAVEPVDVEGGPVVFAIAGTVGGGAASAPRAPGREPRAPREWGEAVARAGRPLDTDEVVQALWPDEAK
jgi:hypothetical protein